MSFIRFIYNIFFRKFLDKSFTLNDFYSLLGFINDIKSEKLIDNYEANEINMSQALAEHINKKEQLLPSVIALINDKKKGPEIRQTLLEHRVLIHAMFYNQAHVMHELSQIIQELENTVKMEEKRRGGYMELITPRRQLKR